MRCYGMLCRGHSLVVVGVWDEGAVLLGAAGARLRAAGGQPRPEREEGAEVQGKEGPAIQ